MERRNVLFGTPNEELIGFSRAVRVGSHVSVAGTASLDDDGNTVGLGDVVAQARCCYEIAARALEEAGASLDDVVRTRTMLTDAADARAVAAVRKEFVGHVQPVETVVVVSGFIDPDWLIEIEVDAIVA